MSWRTKKQHVVASLSVKAEIRAMTQGICELMVEDHLRRLEDQVG